MNFFLLKVMLLQKSLIRYEMRCFYINFIYRLTKKPQCQKRLNHWGHCTCVEPLHICRAIMHLGHCAMCMHGAIAHDWDHCASCVGPLYIMYEANAHDWDIVHHAWGHCTLCMGPLRMIGTIVHHAWGHCTLCISQCA